MDKRIWIKQLLFAALILSESLLLSQPLTQTIRGRVIDKETRVPLPGANVIMLDTTQLLGTATNLDGYFRLENIPVGRVGIRISYLGYAPVVLQNLNLSSAKEMILNIEMEEQITTGKVIEITGKRNKGETLNKMASISAQSFSVEETGRYAGSLNDVARMAANYAGVQGASDWRNDIIIRGNSPTGLLYRLEGVDIPNPNHFSTFGTTGGPISILNNNTLANSDFLTGAFPAEYGNALSGVFDLNLRSGNNEKREFIGQIGFNGAELLAEGPFTKKHQASYLASYRYSTMGLFTLMGIHFGTKSIPEYQDLTFKVNFPHKHGKTTIFGIGGLSSIALLDSKIDSSNNAYGTGTDVRFKTRIGVIGISHTQRFRKNAYLKAVLSTNIFANNIDEDSLSSIDRHPVNLFNRNSALGKYSMNVFFNKKINVRHIVKTGLLADWMFFNLSDSSYRASLNHFVSEYDYQGNSQFIQPYVEWQFRISNKLILNTGLHSQYFRLNHDYSIEPRLGLKWYWSDVNTLAFAYGLHSRLQPVPVYFKEKQMPDGSATLPNKNIEMTKSRHFVMGYERLFSASTRFKMEAYYQHLFNVPVDVQANAFSMLNEGANFDINFPDSMVNKGTGKNYGVEFTLERFLTKGFYYLFSLSLFESRYTGSDGIEHSTAFNGNYTCNALAGKEFIIPLSSGKILHKMQKTLFIDVKGTWNGGQRYTPINLALSQQAGYAVYDQSNIYGKKYKDYLRFDIKAGFRLNGKKTTQEFTAYLQNVTNRNNIFRQTYNRNTGALETSYQMGFLPIFQYRIEF